MAEVEQKLKQAIESDRWLAFIVRETDGTLFFEFETHNFPDLELRKVGHHLNCHIREAIQRAADKAASEGENPRAETGGDAAGRR